MNNLTSKNIAQENCVMLEKYMNDCNANLLHDDDLLNILYNTKGISQKTVSMTKLGFDNKTNLWTIPIIKYSCIDYQVIGFENRQKNLLKNELHRTKRTPNCIAMINEYNSNTDGLCIVGDYFDGYALLQFLTDNERKDKYFHIVTHSREVQDLINCLQEIDYSKYKKYYLYIGDNDFPSNIKLQIFEQYPQFEPVITNCKCKNFNQHYTKCLKGGR